MKIAKIQIKNILGIENQEFEPGKITTISGQNGTGKTSMLEAIKGSVTGGHLVKLIRNGADEAEIVLEFDDGSRIERKINHKSASAKFFNPDGKEIKKSASYIKEIIDPVGLNPISILTAEPKEFTKIILDSIQLELPVDEIKMITGADVSQDLRHPLQVIEERRLMIYEDRTSVNAEAKTTQTMVEEMQATIPFKPDGTNFEDRLKALRDDLEKVNADKNGQANEANDQLAKHIAQLKETAQVSIDKINETLSATVQKANKAHIEAIETIGNVSDPKIAELNGSISETEVHAGNQQKIKGAQDFVDKNREKLATLTSQAEGFTGQINQLDQLKAELVENMPVKGLTVKDGEIKIEGVPFGSLNTAKKIRFALMIAGLRKPKCPIVCVDGLESLDSETFKLFDEEVSKTDMQLFRTVVTDEKELTIV